MTDFHLMNFFNEILFIVERRRRDKINTWIMKIAAVVPDCQMDQSKQGTSKGGVLSKALDHIVKLRQENDCLLYTSPSPRDQRGSRMPSSA